MQSDDIFSAAWRESDWDARVSESAYAHLIEVRDQQAALVTKMLPVLQRMARQYGVGMTLGGVDTLRAALQAWAHKDPEVAK
jgi:hypothetical protein